MSYFVKHIPYGYVILSHACIIIYSQTNRSLWKSKHMTIAEQLHLYNIRGDCIYGISALINW